MYTEFKIVKYIKKITCSKVTNYNNLIFYFTTNIYICSKNFKTYKCLNNYILCVLYFILINIKIQLLSIVLNVN